MRGTFLDTLLALLDKPCCFQPGERDLAVLQHKFMVQWWMENGEVFENRSRNRS